MGRPKQYDRETALRRAYRAFWANGYEATSMQELLSAMGLNRGSLYSGFEGKRTLFMEALRQYRQEVVQERLDALRSAPGARQGLRVFFRSLVAGGEFRRGEPGCLATNSATELATRDAGIADELAAGMRRIEGVFAEVLRRGVASGELPGRLPVRATARYLVGLAQGVNVLSKVMPDREYVRQIVRTGLRVLDA